PLPDSLIVARYNNFLNMPNIIIGVKSWNRFRPLLSIYFTRGVCDKEKSRHSHAAKDKNIEQNSFLENKWKI
ncbi:MAG: hypothetical protein UHG68_07830, partial [Clostridia bacterium]|nr:hypothetical protein [Clostridia bacterium]